MRSTLATFQNLPGKPTVGEPVQPDPSLPLWRLAWEDDRTDLHGVGTVTYNRDDHGRHARTITCHCGQEVTSWSNNDVLAEDAAFAELVRHAHAASVRAA